jgi:GNAT superfamily N-acetyltransferase
VGSLTIRRGALDDAETLYAIHRSSVLTAYAHIFPPELHPFPEDVMRAHWIERLGDPDAATLLAGREGVAAGFVVVIPGWLESLFVVPAAWGRGTGGALHDAAVELLREFGAGARLRVLEENERARRFYERRGWRFDGERRPSGYPPHPMTLRYVLDLDLEGGEGSLGRGARRGPIPNPHPPGG